MLQEGLGDGVPGFLVITQLNKGEAQILEDGGPPDAGVSKRYPKESGSGPVR